MIIDCISDLHGHYPRIDRNCPQLTGGQLLILAGDYTASGKMHQWVEFFRWLKEQPYDKKVLIAGNHDNLFESGFPKSQKEADSLKEVQSFLIEQGEMEKPDFEYLCDSGTEYKGIKVWGSPWSLTFPCMNPHCMAFTCQSEEEIAKKWDLIPQDTQILITHTPPYGLFDETSQGKCVGSKSLDEKIFYQIKLDLHVFGHIHECGGNIKKRTHNVSDKYISVNCSHVNEHYEPVNPPIRIVLT